MTAASTRCEHCGEHDPALLNAGTDLMHYLDEVTDYSTAEAVSGR